MFRQIGSQACPVSSLNRKSAGFLRSLRKLEQPDPRKLILFRFRNQSVAALITLPVETVQEMLRRSAQLLSESGRSRRPQGPKYAFVLPVAIPSVYSACILICKDKQEIFLCNCG